MSDRRGQIQALTLLPRIIGGRQNELRDRIEGLAGGEDSPFRQLPGTHFARLVIVPHLLLIGDTGITGERVGSHLLFSTTFDGELEPHLNAICERIPETADAIFGACERYPGCADPRAFGNWAREQRLRSAAIAGGYVDATVEDVREALALRERLHAFVTRAQGVGDRELQAAFVEEFVGHR